MAEFCLVKKSQVSFFKTIPFYYKTQAGEFALYKKTGDRLNEERLKQIKYPDLYISNADQQTAITELNEALKRDFEDKVKAGNLKDVRVTLEHIVEEALTPGQENNMNTLPETIEILLGRYDRNSKAMDFLSKIASNSSLLVKHTVNVMALTLQYCFYHKFPGSDTRQLCMAALLHDIGCAQIDRSLLESDRLLSDNQFEIYKTHAELGHDLIIVNTEFDVALPTVALEHHERLDGKGYPNGMKRISSYSQLIGLIDSYESLTYREKKYRKAKKPFDALTLIKDEVLQGKFSKDIFKKFTSCLVK